MKNLIFRLQFLMLLIFEQIVLILPIKIAYKMADNIGLLIYIFAKKRVKIIYKNLDIVYTNGIPFNKCKFAKKVFSHIIKIFVDALKAQKLINRENWQNYIKGDVDFIIKNSNRQCVFVSGHFGSFEILANIYSIVGYPLLTVIRKLYNPYINKKINSLREVYGQEIICKKDAFYKLIDGIKEKKCPVLVVDQHGGKKTLYVDFLGKKAYTPTTPAYFARKYNLPIMFGVLFRTGNFEFTLHAEEIKIPPFTENEEKDLENITLLINQTLGKYIKKCPEQWFWLHRRWR